jgi:hypothetical protein
MHVVTNDTTLAFGDLGEVQASAAFRYRAR